jgi:hypothetical protein
LTIPDPDQVPPGISAERYEFAAASQNGPAGLITGTCVELITTFVVVDEVHPFSEVVTVYVPAALNVAGIDPFCVEAVNPFGPDQL